MSNPGEVVFCQYRDSGWPTWLHFCELVDVVQTWQPEDVLPKLAAVQEAVDRGLCAAGFLAYEAAPAMDEAFRTHPGGNLPLLWFGLFRSTTEENAARENHPEGFSVGPWQPSITPEQYQDAIDRIKEYIARGHTYQVNYTFRLRTSFAGDPWSFFRRLCEAQRGLYAAYLDIGDHLVCSASPELFFSLDGDLVCTRPMKGTSPRGLTSPEDQQRRAILAGSPKDRAENAMIVDMMRNDLGRIARRGSVRVLSAFDVEKYPTLFQMTSTVAARTSVSVAEIIKALFPPASITGAPKIRTMEIIRELEPDPRGVYTGCIGFLLPGRKARFSVAIRTVTIEPAAAQAQYGVGGGIVWDSNTTDEYAECRTKAAVLTAEVPRFALLETFLYEADRGYFLLEPHLQRLVESADYFDFALDLAEVRRRLNDLRSGFADKAHRVRLCVDRQGQVAVESAPLPAGQSAVPWRLRLNDRPVSSGSVFLYHKTTWRGTYEAAYASRGECDDVVLWNEQRQATETTIANLVVEEGGRLVTPPVACGLLPGVFRAHLLETGQIREQVVTVDDLCRAKQLFAVNSVRKWLPAVMVSGTPA